MTELELQEKIKSILEYKIFPEMAIFTPGTLKVLLQDIPASKDYEYESETDESAADKWFPCCIVQLESGINPKVATAQDTQINIIMCVKDYSRDMSGYKSVVIALNRIRDYFLSEYGIHGKFRINFPIKLEMNIELAAPYFMGRLVTTWTTDTKVYRDYEKFI